MCLLILISSISFAEVYKWIDEDGNIKFSQFPPENKQIKSEELAVTPQHSSSVKISEEQLIGNWRCISSDGNTFDIEINEDRTMSMILMGKMKGEMHGSGSYKE
ncbi:DUF4124 domain-containing protein [Colwellia sp. MSW7]|uniref:DUF4124 domain-containing protein n=1 Tax=Colwellia maritima TaxID=2912588 RepID=A0ABS9WZ10_9GAMM|nr:DUF4124 domain-containing protein [Colwellia maritima]MCI2282461.1 DUF4124 domain-containing protein [Colwellia maritima]